MGLSSEKESEKLAVFLGAWTITGQDFTAIGSGQEISGEETYEWLPGAQLLVNNWTKNSGGVIRTGTGIIGMEFSHHAFSAQDNENEIYTRSYNLHCRDEYWLIIGERERAVFAFNEELNQFSQKWECTTDGQHWSNMWEIKGQKRT